MDDELVNKSKELGFNLSKTFENHLKQLVTHFNTMNLEKSSEIQEYFGSPGEIRTPVRGSRGLHD